MLGIEVDPALLDLWRSWLMPAVQPFLIPGDMATEAGRPDGRRDLSPEMRDSFELYGLADSDAVIWLSRSEARTLPHGVRRAQPGAHHWPSDNADRDVARMVRWVQAGRRNSRHSHITEMQWRRIEPRLPGARALAGRFPQSSGPNFFGTVMAVAGITSAATEWMQITPFESWLAMSTRPGGSDDEPGTVFVWRDQDGRPVHAAITIGDGWLIHKPSQGRMSPVKVLSVQGGKCSARTPGWYLSRYRLN